jgi:hypothetical protein
MKLNRRLHLEKKHGSSELKALILQELSQLNDVADGGTILVHFILGALNVNNTIFATRDPAIVHNACK